MRSLEFVFWNLDSGISLEFEVWNLDFNKL